MVAVDLGSGFLGLAFFLLAFILSCLAPPGPVEERVLGYELGWIGGTTLCLEGVLFLYRYQLVSLLCHCIVSLVVRLACLMTPACWGREKGGIASVMERWRERES